MAIYRYIATESGTGAQRRGELAADSAYQVRAALRRMGLAPVRVDVPRDARARGAGASHRRTAVARWARSRRRSQLAELYESLSALLATGTTLADALELLARARGRAGGGGAVGTLCRAMSERIRHGAGLAEAMAERAEWFDAVGVALVRAAEQTGELERTLADLAEHAARSDELRGRLAAALAYPALLTVFGLGVVVFLTTTTLPQLAGAIADAGAELPRATEALLWVGDALTTRWPLALLAGAAVVVAALALARSPRAARWVLRTPLLGRAVGRAQTASASELLARMLEGGVPLREALELVAPTVPNAALRAELTEMRLRLESGRPMLRPEEADGVLEPVFRRVVEVGQETGELASSLRAIGRRHRASSRRLIDRLAATLEPAAILLLATLIGAVAYAAIAPMLRLAQSI